MSRDISKKLLVSKALQQKTFYLKENFEQT